MGVLGFVKANALGLIRGDCDGGVNAARVHSCKEGEKCSKTLFSYFCFKCTTVNSILVILTIQESHAEGQGFQYNRPFLTIGTTYSNG